MKGFLITMAILTATAIIIFTQYDVIGGKVLASIEAEEGTPEAIKEQQAKDPKGLAARCQPLIAKRWKLAWSGNLLGESELAVLAAKGAMARYLLTDLERDEDMEKLLFLLGTIKEKVLPPQEAHDLFKQYIELFPNGKNIKLVQNALANHAVKYGMF